MRIAGAEWLPVALGTWRAGAASAGLLHAAGVTEIRTRVTLSEE
jgi:hypothetical protein